MFAIVESGSITSMPRGNKGVQIGDVKHPADIFTACSSVSSLSGTAMRKDPKNPFILAGVIFLPSYFCLNFSIYALAPRSFSGSVAKTFEEIGGKVEYFGKPYPLVYNLAAETKNKRILCIGDNLNTDIRGSNIQSFDSLLISNGIHKKEIETNNFENILKKYEVNVNFIQSNLSW